MHAVGQPLLHLAKNGDIELTTNGLGLILGIVTLLLSILFLAYLGIKR